MHRFFVPHLDPDALTLSGEQAHHCVRVLRLGRGDEIELFDGCGEAIRCRIEAATGRMVRLVALQRCSSPPLPCRITLAMAVIKKHFDFIVQKATELGVAAIIPLISERTIVRADKTLRWTEMAVEACKQCGNNWLPLIAPTQRLEDFLCAPSHFDLMLVAALQPDARPAKTVIRSARSVCVLIGPEGDFTPTEYAAIRAAGFRPITLGPLVLRADTAALYTLSVVHHELVTHAPV